MEKGRFERDLSILRKRNADLNLLRTHFSPREARPKPKDLIVGGTGDEVIQLSAVRSASSMLYDTLKESWACSDDSHIRHWVKLCLDCDLEPRPDSVTLNLAFSSDIAAQRYDTNIAMKNFRMTHRSRRSWPTAWVTVRSDSGQPSSMSRGRSDFGDLVRSLQNTSKSLQETTSIPGGDKSESVPTKLLSQQAHTLDLCQVGCASSHRDGVI